MAINVYLGVCSCDNDVVDKTDFLEMEENAESCVFVNTDLLNPILKMTKGKKSYNYVHIPYFGDRWYYIESYEGLAGEHCLLHCHVDVLHTYHDSITALSAYVLRNEDITKWKKDMTDRCIPASNRRIVEGWNFGDNLVRASGGENADEYVLGVIGYTAGNP